MLRDTLAPANLGGAQIGVTNPGGLRDELFYNQTGAEGDGVITFAEANNVLPFVNNLWTTTLTGAQFKTLLEQQWQRDASGQFRPAPYLQLGLSDNVTYTFDDALPEGSRITSITINGAPYDPAAQLPHRHVLVPGDRRRQLPDLHLRAPTPRTPASSIATAGSPTSPLTSLRCRPTSPGRP